MEKDLGNYRKSYEQRELLKKDAPQNPMQLFQKWLFEVQDEAPQDESNAMTVSTLGVDGFPKSRVVLLKKYSGEGFVFYTNYESEKGRSIDANPKMSLSFFWPQMERQVIVKGIAEKVSDLDSENYFDSRPLGSRVGAIVSPQSQVIPSREFLEDKAKELEAADPSRIKRPAHWGGYLVRPVEIEFWQGRPNRLHDRIRYSLENNLDWKIERLAP